MLKYYIVFLGAVILGYLTCEIHHQEEDLKRRREKMRLQEARRLQEEQWSREYHMDHTQEKV